MEKKNENKSTGKTIAIVVLVVLLLGAVGYIGYDKFLANENGVSSKEEKSEKNKEIELDVNSRLVTALYNKVSTGESSEEEATCTFNQMYEYDYDSNSYKDFYADKASENQKMRILALHLDYNGEESIICSEISIPDKLKDGNVDYTSMCAYTKDKNDFEDYYNRKSIETLYKDLYGKDAKLDTSEPIYEPIYGAFAYKYIDNLDKYMKYVIDTGGVCGPIGMYGTITKAIKTSDSLKIYEKVTTINAEDENNKITTDTNYVYTFKLDSDGMYDFISRVKES